MKTTVNGLVIREAEYRDNDKVLTILTDRLGLITVTARGVRKMGSPLFSLANLFTYSALVLNETKGRYYLSGGEPLEQFYELRGNLEKLSLAIYLAEVISHLAAYDEDCLRLLQLICKSFYALSRNSKNLWLVKSVFEEKCAIYSGVWPHFESCGRCGRYSDNICFNPVNFSVFCPECAREDGFASLLSPPVLAALRFISEKEVSKAFSFTLSDENLGNLNRITESVLLSGLEREFQSLKFFKSILVKK